MSIDFKTRRISKSIPLGAKFELFRKTLDYDESVKSSDDENDDYDVECQNYVFEIGPPKVLKHIPESKLLLTKCDSPDHINKKFFELELKDLLNGGMICDFCQSIAHRWSTIHETYCCNDFIEYVQGLIDCQKHTDSLRENLRFDHKTLSFVTKVHKTTQIFKRKLNQIRKLSRLYTLNIPQKKIPIVVSKKDVTKKEINISKNLNEIEEKFQQLLTDRQADTISNDSFDSQDTKAKSRINYLLSNVKYVDRGWTIVNNDHESNLYTKKQVELGDQTLSEPNSIDIWSSHVSNPIIKNYKNGKTFQIIHADRTGNIYYPNGRLALLICNSGNYRSFIAFSADEVPVTLASFDSEGNAYCNYNSGQLRYHINSNGGINFDQSGNCIRKWLFPDDSTKTLTFHPIRFSINEFMSVQIHNKFKIIFQFRSRHAACKFLIKLNHTNFEESTEYNQFQVLPNETVCLKLKSRAENLLRLLQINAQASSTRSSKLLKRPSLYNSSDTTNNRISRTTNHSINATNNPNAEFSLKFPRLQFNLPEQFSNKESYTYSVSKSSFLDNTSSLSTTTRSSNRLDKNTMNNSIVFSLQSSVRS